MPLSLDKADPRLQGVIGPLVTPFQSGSGDVDLAAFSRNVRAHLAAGQVGVLVAGSTGEAALLDEGERAALVESARGVVPQSGVLLVGVGAESTRLTIRRAREAAARGADGVLVVSPHYYTATMTRDALRAHFTAVADESPVPVLLYNIKKYAHFIIEPELVAELAAHRNIVGMKDSDGDLSVLERFAAVQKSVPRFSVLTGHGPTFATALSLGVRGGILAVALFTGDIAPRIFAAHRDGNTALAAELQELITQSAREVIGVHGVAGVKTAMDAVGLSGGPVRSPLIALGEAQKKAVLSLVPRSGNASERAGGQTAASR